ncbi:MAG: hypothetical protein JEZ12_28005, partial [Desulfobacterium sp.]|nr:hypothetical protein [Desulfobacterium sp.]
MESQRNTGTISARALLIFGIAHRPLNLGPVIPPTKTLVMPESVVPLFEAPTDQHGQPYKNHFRPGEPLSDFGRMAVASF